MLVRDATAADPGCATAGSSSSVSFSLPLQQESRINGRIEFVERTTRVLRLNATATIDRLSSALVRSHLKVAQQRSTAGAAVAHEVDKPA